MPYRNMIAKIWSRPRIWRVAVYQTVLIVAAIAAWRVLQSPSTMTFFVLELGVALAVGFFFHVRKEIARGRTTEAIGGSLSSPAGEIDAVGWGAAKSASFSELNANLRYRPRNQGIFHGLTALFLFLIAIEVLTLSRSLYTAPLQFYALVGIAVGTLALNVHLSGEAHPAPLLAQIVVQASVLKFHFLFLNPNVATSDIYLYFVGFRDLATTGYIPTSLGHYYFFPTFATFAYTGVSVLGLPLELFSAFGFASQVAMIPIIYLIGQHVATRRTGLFASIFASLTIFMFIYNTATPTHFGVSLIFLSIFAAIRMGGANGRLWLVVFWLAALAVLFSHPINGLILAFVLYVRAVWTRTAGRTRTPALPPALSYSVAYGTYLAFVAYTAFDLFVRSFFVVEYGPALATTPVPELERSTLFVLQSALAPLGIALPFFLAGYAVLARRGMARPEHGFLVTIGAAFILIPGLEFLGENFKLQTSRMLVYFSIPIVLLAAHGLHNLLAGTVRARRAAIGLLGLFLVLGFAASSSYLGQNDSRDVYTDVPFAPSHVTESALASRSFMNLIPPYSTVYLELASWRYFAHTDRAKDPLQNQSTPDLLFFQELGGSGFVVLNAYYLPYGMSSVGTFYDLQKIDGRIEDRATLLLYDSGVVRMYYVP